MHAEGVKIVDQNGKLLTEQADPLLRAGLNATQLEYVRLLEQGFIERIDKILAPLAGKGNYGAQVAADVDFNQVEQTAETYKPNPTRPGDPQPADQQGLQPAAGRAGRAGRAHQPAAGAGHRADHQPAGGAAAAGAGPGERQPQRGAQLRARPQHPARQAGGRADQAPVGRGGGE